MKRVKIFIIIMILIILTLNTNIVFASYNSRAFVVGINNEAYVQETVDSLGTSLSQMGYITEKCIGPEMSYFTGNYGGSITRLASGVVCLIGHGNNQSLYVRLSTDAGNNGITYAYDSGSYTGNGQIYNYINIKDVNFKNSNMVIFAACNTATGTENITRKTYEQGAMTTMGWRDTVHMYDLKKWLDRFFDALNVGYTIQDAYNYALSAIDYVDKWSISKASLFGDTERVIKKSTATSLLNSENLIGFIKNQRIIKNEELTFNNSNLKSNSLNIFLENNYENFNSNKYVKKVYEHGNENYTVDYIFKLGEFETNIGYSLGITNGNVTYIEDSAKNIILPHNEEIENMVVTDEIIDSAKKKAISNINLPINSNIINQRTEKFYDFNKNKAYIKVITEYETKEINKINEMYKSLDVYFYEL